MKGMGAALEHAVEQKLKAPLICRMVKHPRRARSIVAQGKGKDCHKEGEGDHAVFGIT